MQIGLYDIFSIAVILMTLLGIKLLSSPRTSVTGNRLGALAMLGAIIVVLLYNKIVDFPLVIAALVVGGAVGAFFAQRVTMLKMPQMVALLNGFGGMASLLVATIIVFDRFNELSLSSIVAGQLAIIVGGITFGGSAIAAAKLDKKMNQRPIVLKGHNALGALLMGLMVLSIVGILFTGMRGACALSVALAVISLAFGVIFAIRVGGADMPVTISLLNSYSGLAASVCGFAIGDYLLVSIGALVGAAGFILTRIMCRAMNRSLVDILTGRTSYSAGQMKPLGEEKGKSEEIESGTLSGEEKIEKAAGIIGSAKSVIMVPGYGMALSQAQFKVKELFDLLIERGKKIKFAIHPVAGRMPGHMNVLLAEVDVPYDCLCELGDINPEFGKTDAVIIIGACDVVNPAAISAEGTPIYGMPILHVHEARNVVVCNLDLKPGYSGVDNPLYSGKNVTVLTGNASETLSTLLEKMK